jgi:hypothetical protein
MRRLLIERARRKGAGKRGGDWRRIDLEKVEIAADADDDTLLLVNDAIEKLAQEDANAAEMATLRFFGGLTLEEAAQVLGVTGRTANRYWALPACGFSTKCDKRSAAESQAVVVFCWDFSHWKQRPMTRA